MGWGHSTWRQAVQFALLSKVRKYVMFHHDPTHTDDQLDEIVAMARELWGEGGGGELEMAREGMQLDI